MPLCSMCYGDSQRFRFGDNAQPINDGRCCDKCNAAHVIKCRLANVEIPNEALESYHNLVSDVNLYLRDNSIQSTLIRFDGEHYNKNHFELWVEGHYNSEALNVTLWCEPEDFQQRHIVRSTVFRK